MIAHVQQYPEPQRDLFSRDTCHERLDYDEYIICSLS